MGQVARVQRSRRACSEVWLVVERERRRGRDRENVSMVEY